MAESPSVSRFDATEGLWLCWRDVGDGRGHLAGAEQEFDAMARRILGMTRDLSVDRWEVKIPGIPLPSLVPAHPSEVS